MPFEQRLILFENEETMTALAAANRMAEESFVAGEIVSCEVIGNARVSVKAEIPDAADGQPVEFNIPEDVLLDTLIPYCIENNIKLPRVAEKRIRFMKNRVALNVRLGDLLELAVEKADLQLDGTLKETV